MVYDNFIMSYNPHLNAKPLTYNSLPTFTPWSQSFNNILNTNLPSNPFRNLPLTPFNPFHSPLIHQQNNFYNSNFTINQMPTNLIRTLPTSFPSLMPNQSSKQQIFPVGKVKQVLKPNEVIQISDDDEVVQVKPLIAVIKQKTSIPINHSKVNQNKLNQHQQKQFIQKKKPFQIKELIIHDIKKQQKIGKNISKIDVKDEGVNLGKKKKITKQKFTYKLSQQEKALMKISKYREYRPDLIMVGPQFQAKITTFQFASKDISKQISKLRQNLLMRRHD